MNNPVRRARIRVYGRVQGVGFRWSAVREAGRRGLTGWVRNLPDGSVETLAEGSDLECFLAWCKKGPLVAQVDRSEVIPERNGETLTAFHIRTD